MVRVQINLNEIKRENWESTEKYFKQQRISKSAWFGEMLTLYSPEELMQLAKGKEYLKGKE